MSSFLFVCLGNICRSPLAEAAMRDAAARAGLTVEVDSAGTAGWHTGKAPDPRSVAVAARRGIDISGYAARAVCAEDFRRFDYVLALDPQNLRDLRAVAPADARARVMLLMDLVPGRQGQGVRDPYYDDERAFESVWAEVREAAEALVARIAG